MNGANMRVIERDGSKWTTSLDFISDESAREKFRLSR